MSESEPFAELLRKLMAEGAGRTAWLNAGSRASRQASGRQRRHWGLKEIADACGVGERTVQTWRASKNPQEPNETNLWTLATLFHGESAAREWEAFRAAWLAQQHSRRRREAGDSWSIQERGSPYRGIATPLTEKDAPIFFGRGTQRAILIDKVRRHPCVFVLGASGAGKSSLVWAGLIPDLTVHNAIAGSRHWKWLRITPAGQGGPVPALARALAGAVHAVAQIEAELDAGSLAAVVQEVLAGRPEQSQLILFVDQFEELFTLVTDAQQRTRFVAALGRLIETRRVRVVATMRAEFLAHCAGAEGCGEQLAAWLTDGSFVLAAPTADALREMILGPAQTAGLMLEDGLVDRIVADTGSKPGNLPLMAFALERLFGDRERDGLMTQAAYERFGGVAGAIAQRAASTLNELALDLGEDVECALADVFRELVEVDEDAGAAVRRRVPLSRLPEGAPVSRFIDRFVEARLLVRASEAGGAQVGPDGGPTLEVAHEALFQSWPRLAEWIAVRRDQFVLRQRLAREARDWERRGRPKAYLWSDERALDAADMIRGLAYRPTATEREFLGPVELEDMLERLEIDATGHDERAAIGVRLALLGDPRPGVGLRGDGLPDIRWLRVDPAADTPSGAEPAAFWIAQYPVSCGQYRAFIDDPEGYASRRWWKDLERGYAEPGDQSPNYANHPAVNVLWCEAIAFCRWLGAKTRTCIRLPTDRQWRQAATGGRPKQKYPWGNSWRDDAANTDASRLNRAVAVGLYPRGRSPVGALDMAGNVWEWCLNAPETRPGADAGASRATLGGSWNSLRQDVVIQHQGGYDLNYRNLNTGFRIIRLDGKCAPTASA